MVLHLRSLNQDTLASKVYKEQRTNKWPGLAEETQIICEELGIEDCNITQKDKFLIGKV